MWGATFCKNFIFLISFQCTSSSLLSRFRYPNEYVVPSEDPELSAQLPEDWSEHLVGDVSRDLEPELGLVRKPDLRQHQMPYLRRRTTLQSGSGNDYDYRSEGPPDKDEEDGQLGQDQDDAKDKDRESAFSKLQESIPNIVYYTYKPSRNLTAEAEMRAGEHGSRMMPYLSRLNGSRRWLKDWFGTTRFEGPMRAKCYSCNHKYVYDIPLSPACHDAFESHDNKFRTEIRKFRLECIFNAEYFDFRIRQYWWGPWKYHEDRGLKRQACGHFIGGCAKSFLDIGTVYTMRFCRSHYPHAADHFMSHRYARLELILFTRDNVCIATPYATLVPYARSISLFVRHHVCVCNDRNYCNHATSTAHTYTMLLITTIIFVVILL